MLTCDPCLDARHHRCRGCACPCATKRTARPAAPSVSRAATPAKPVRVNVDVGREGRPARSRVGRGLGGRPQLYVGDDRRTRRAAAARAARARNVDRAAAEAEWRDDPTGLTWSTGARRLFAADLDRLAAAAAGL